MSADLSLSEEQLLTLHEDAIEASKTDIVTNLMAIRDQRLYRPVTFEEYCRRRWGLSRSYVNRMIAAADVIKQLAPIGTINEGQARELAKVPADRRVEVFEEAMARTAGKVTAKALAGVVKRVRQDGEAPPPTPGPTGMRDPVVHQDGPTDPAYGDIGYPGTGNGERVSVFASDDLADRSRDIRESRGADYTVIPIHHDEDTYNRLNRDGTVTPVAREPQFQLDDPGDLNRDAVAFALRNAALDHARQMIANDPSYSEALYWALGTALTESRISNA